MSFPYLSDLLKALTGWDLPLPVPMFGLFVALAMLSAAHYLRLALERMQRAGQIGSANRTRVGKDGKPEVIVLPAREFVADFTVIVMLAGVAGARLFHLLEHLDALRADPRAMIFTTSGLSIFGGLIMGTLAGLLFVRRWNLPLRQMQDAVAPAMMLGYAIGRIGCQIAGDGDWGIASNLALKPAFVPTFLWAQTYTHNIVGELIAPPGVYPTPLYEVLMALACFALLTRFARHPFRAGWLFSFYLLLAGMERLLIEQIRINPVLDFFGLHATQAEFISVIFMVLGLAGMLLLGRRAAPASSPQQV